MSKDIVFKDKDAAIDYLRGHLQNCVNHLERAKRHWPRGDYDECIGLANNALYQTLKLELKQERE